MSFIEMSLAGAAMILVIALIRALAINRVPKRTFPVLWGAALMRLLIPFYLPSGLSVYSVLARSAPPAAAYIMHASAAAIPAASLQAASAPRQGPSALCAVWVCGLILCTAAFAAAYIKCCREFRMSLPVENDFVRRWLHAHPLRRPLSVRQSGIVSSPLTFGVLRPVILMPKRTDWTDEAALQFVLEHEYVHICRFDAAFKLLLAAAVCAHWFNPAVWLMYVLANRDIELACDEAVIRRFGRGARASYARVLIGMEEARSGLAPLCSHFGKNAIEERITAIMKTGKSTAASLVLAAVLVAGTAAFFATSAKDEPAGTGTAAWRAVAVETAAGASSSGGAAVEAGAGLKPSAEYRAAGISAKKDLWYYQGQPIAAIYDDNGNIYMDDKAADGVYLNVGRDAAGGVSGAAVITKEQFRDMAQRHMEARSVPG